VSALGRQIVLKTVRIKLWLVIFACALLSVRGVAGELPINTDAVSKSVVFLYNEQNAAVGTAFLVAIPLKDDPKQVKLALVTARHVVDPQWACGAGANPTSLLARLNVKNYVSGLGQTGTNTVRVVLVENGRNVFFTHPDERVDAVVISISRPDKIAENDVAYINLRDFATSEELQKYKVGVGDGIISAGLVPYFAAENRNYPAFKFGKISSVLGQPIEKSRCGPQSHPRSTWSWVVAGNFVGGNSGSPIFLLPLEFTLGKGLTYTGPRVMLLGLLSASIEGADLSEMTPVEYIFEIIKAHYPEADLYRGPEKEVPTPAK
jgi:hypothetical protein